MKKFTAIADDLLKFIDSGRKNVNRKSTLSNAENITLISSSISSSIS